MKKQFLALIGGVMVAGLAMAAEVLGNNEAVVIQKSVVKSFTGFQFLCVPVAPLDITGADSAEQMTLAELLPPSLYPETTTVSPVNDSSVLYTITEVSVKDENGDTVKVKQWQKDNLDAGTDEFAKGTIFWMNYRREAVYGDLPATVFCGQALDATKVTGTSGQIVACGNTSSEAKTLDELIDSTKVTRGSLVYVIEAGKTDYKTYQYDGTKWCTWNAFGEEIAFTGKIAAGEAFYYLKK